MVKLTRKPNTTSREGGVLHGVLGRRQLFGVVIGLAALLVSISVYAAINAYINIEAESGASSGNVGMATDATASGGQAVKFGEPASEPGVPTLTKTVIVDGLTRPWDVAFVDDGTMFFTQRSNRFSVRETNGTVRQITRITDAAQGSEGGLMSVEVDPNFASNRYIYICLSSDIDGAIDNRVVRWTVNSDYTAIENRTNVVTGINYTTGRHSGCRVQFGPDGYLWIGTGDSGTSTVPQDKYALGAKVLRVDRNGNPAPGNAGAGFDPRVYTYGHRNVQGLMFRPGTGQAFNVEQGTAQDDEVNRLVAGANYGYRPIKDDEPGRYYEQVPMTDLARYPDAIAATWSSGSSTIATSGGTFLSGPQWRDWDGRAVIGVQKGRHLMILQFNEAGTQTLSVEQVFTEEGYRLRSVEQGPDGNLYVTTDNSGGIDQIWRVTPS